MVVSRLLWPSTTCRSRTKASPCRAWVASAFLGQQSWQRDRNSPGFILGCVGLGYLQLALQGWGQAVRKQDHAALVAFGLVDVKAALFEVDVFDAQVEGLAHSQPAGVKEVDDEAGGVRVDVRHTGQELQHVLAVRARAQVFLSGIYGPSVVYPGEMWVFRGVASATLTA